MNTNKNILLDKLEGFIKKYYTNQLIKGAIWFTGLFVLAFLSISLLEYFGWYNQTGRAVLFYILLITATGLLAYYIIYPLSKILKLGKTLTTKEAAQIVGNHFPEIKDKLLNTLQLMQSATEMDLLQAAISQKTNQLTPIPFGSAINYKKNLKYVRFAIWPVAALLAILIIAPSLITDGSKRVINYKTTFVKPAPFTFNIVNKNLLSEQFADFELEVEMQGEILPNDVFIALNQNQFKLSKKTNTNFTYTFKNIQQTTQFALQADGFSSKNYTINVLAKPVLINYTATVNYPSYLGGKQETFNNPTDLNIPAGTTIKWNFTAKQTDQIELGFNKIKTIANKLTPNTFNYSKKFFLSDLYTIKPVNKFTQTADSLQYNIVVTPDEYPTIDVAERLDSTYSKLIYLAGNATDDYGLTKLTFNFRYLSEPKLKQGLKVLEIPINAGKQININHNFSLYEIGFETGDEIEYYFEVWDNDGVHKPKSVKSRIFKIKAPDKAELKAKASEGSKNLENKMEQTLKEINDLQKDLNNLQRKMQNNQPLTWEEKRKAEELLQRQKELTKKIEAFEKDYKQKNIAEQEFKEEDKRILEKQMQLEKMYKDIMTDEMKKLLQQMEQMLKMQNKDLLNKELNKLELNNKDIEKELDRMLEMYKELEVEKKMQDAANNLKDLAQKQKELSEKTEKKELTKEEIAQKQEELNKEFEDIKKDLDNAEKQNKELESPKELPSTEEKEKSIDQKMQNSKKENDKGNNKKSAQQQKEAADEMEQMANDIESGMESEEEKEDELDAKALREILENLVQLSKDQEDLMERFKTINGYNPQFIQLAQEQKILKDNAKLVEDSLLALSKRVPQVKAYVNREVTKMNDHLNRSVKGFSDRNIPETRTNQQYAMTGMNNLAVMLSDVLKQMQQQMQMKSKSGKGKGKPKPQSGGGKPSMSKLKKMQEELNKQLKDGLNKNGSSGEKGQMSSEQFARMAAQQMAIRQQMQKMLQQMDALEKQQLGGGKQLGDLQKMMEQTEKDLVNKRLTQETLMRQQDILTRLLEHEKAEKKQDQDTKRESEQPKEYPKPSPKYFDDLNKKQQKETELLRTVPAQMQPYYKEKAKEYLQTIE